MARPLTNYMKAKSLNTYCPKCEAKPGESCQGTNGGWANLHEERKTNARKRKPLVAKNQKAKAPAYPNNNFEAWLALTEAEKDLVMDRTCPFCRVKPGEECVSSGGNHIPMPHKERQIGQSFLINQCPTCDAGVGKVCRNNAGRDLQNGFTHVARRELLAPLGGVKNVSYAPAGVLPPKKVVLIGDDEDILPVRDKTVILTEEMAKDLAAHLRGTRPMDKDTVLVFADLLHHIPTPVELGALKLSGLGLEDFFGLPLEQREEWLDAFREAMSAYVEARFEGESDSSQIIDELLVELI